jgi:hypothetical protein
MESQDIPLPHLHHLPHACTHQPFLFFFPFFGLQDVVLGLVSVYNSTTTENVKATTASTLSRLLRSSPHLMPVLLEHCGLQIIMQGGLMLGSFRQQLCLF